MLVARHPGPIDLFILWSSSPSPLCSFHLWWSRDSSCHMVISPLPQLWAVIQLTAALVSVLLRGSFSESAKRNRGGCGGAAGGCSDDYAHPPPPVSAVYSLSLPSSPVLYRKAAAGGGSRNVPTPGRTSSPAGLSPPRALTAPCSPAAPRSTRQQGVSTTPTPHSQYRSPAGWPTIQSSAAPRHERTLRRHPDFIKQRSVDELRCAVQTVASTLELGTQDVHHLGQQMAAASEMMKDTVEENAQALFLLAEVVDKLQGLIVARRRPEPPPPLRLNQQPPPSPPPRVSSVSPQVLHKPPTPSPHRLPSSSGSSCSSSSSSLSSCEAPQSVGQMNGGCRSSAVNYGAPRRTGGNGQVRLNNGSISGAPAEERQDCDSTGCLATRRKKNKK